MSSEALEQLVAIVAELKRDDPMAPVTIIVPSNVAGRSVGWRLAAGLGDGRRGVAGLRITTLARLAESVAAVHLQPRRPLLPSILAAAWRSELESVAASGAPWEFAEVWDHPSTVAALVTAYRELREVPESCTFGEGAGSVPQETIGLARSVRNRLRQDWYDQQDLFATASGLTTGKPAAFKEFGSIIHYLPGDEPGSAAKFIETLDENLGIRTVHDEQPHHADRILHASDADDEIRAVVREVVAELANEKPAHRLAICFPRADPYVRVIHGLLDAAGVEFNGRGGIPVAEVSCARAFLTLLELPSRGFPRAMLFETLSSWPMRQLDGGEPVPLVTWERISREANVAGGEGIAESWVPRLKGYLEQSRYAERHQDAERLGTFVATLEQRLHELDSASTWEEVSTLSLRLLADLLGELSDIRDWKHEEKRAYVTVHQALKELRSLDQFRAPRGLGDLLDVLTTEFESAVPRVGKFGKGVFVGPIDQARGLDLDRVWVVGLSEDMYPGRQQEGALLPEVLRTATPELVSAGDRVKRLERDLISAFASARMVTASFPRGDLRASSERLPSCLLLPSLRELSDRRDLPATQWYSAPPVDTIVDCPSHAAGITRGPLPATEQEWAMRRVLNDSDSLDDAPYAAGRHLLQHRNSDAFTRFDGNLTGASGLPNLAADDRRISPTALESFARCPFAYFVKRLLRVEPVEEPTVNSAIKPIDRGNIFHRAMDRFMQAELEAGRLPGPGEPWTPEHHERIAQVADAVIANSRERGELGHPTLWGFEEPRVRAEINRMLTDDSAWRASVGAAPIAAELRFGFDDAEHAAAEVEVPGGVIRFLGSADKVDVAGDTVYITDIKTGSADNFRRIAPKRGTPNRTVDGTKLQLPVYAKAALAAVEGAERAAAQYWFVNGKSAGERVNLDLTDDLDQHFSHVVGSLVSGVARGHFFKKPSKDPGFLWVDCEYCTPGGAGHESTRTAYLAKRRHADLLPLLDVIDPDAANEIRDAQAREEAHDEHQ